MIGKVSGRIDYVAEDHALIEAAGVGYEIYCSSRTLAALPPAGEVAALYTSMLVREDLMQLFGFPTREEREWHRLLTSVQGVGAKVGLAILGALGPEGAGRAITLGDAAAVKAAPGVGPKLAQRIVNELKGKAPALMALGAASSAPAEALVVVEAPASHSSASTSKKQAAAKTNPDAARRAAARADALSALVNLGYGEGEAAQAVATVEAAAAGDAEGGGEAPDLIRAALKALAPSG
ncbi:MAG: Holliday junction branch migration protein RuvA [Pseudomonadota bacterium]